MRIAGANNGEVRPSLSSRRTVRSTTVLDTARTGGLAIEARQAAIQVLLRAAGDFAALEHLLDQINAATRTVEFIAQQLVRRASGIAEAAMHAFADDGLCLLALRRTLEFRAQMRLHGGHSSAYKRPGLNTRAGSKACFNPW
jgi:hypothetical protein